MPRCVGATQVILAPQLSSSVTLYEYDDMVTLCAAIDYNGRRWEAEYVLPSPPSDATHYASSIETVAQLAANAVYKQLDSGVAVRVVDAIAEQLSRGNAPLGIGSRFDILAEWCLRNYPPAIACK
jgi:hypothetical protein